ncbi:hypothetical protein ONZ43_g1323 [Nemania bipapillata]|uniref:Uncharacterized protein n=1 Tax=Nemania bipapillata TaxID=110536 RepID=A0ACC2J4T8_9PEZI|nr:hypothetical protein ONZ43_g1323 [Nemania bipapillata]
MRTINSAPTTDRALLKPNFEPFKRLKRGNYFHGRPDMDVYKILIDAYRLRMHDMAIFTNDNDKDSIYGGAEDGLAGFRRFLCRAKAVPRMLPSWWGDKKQAECEQLGCQEGWSSLDTPIDHVAVRQYYKDKYMDIQLRLLAEDIYGTSIGHASSKFLRNRVMSLLDGSTITMGKALRETVFRELRDLLLDKLWAKV